nr:Rho termination factor N-terminal domain-containing protein [Mesorhizobium sp. WSM2561]
MDGALFRVGMINQQPRQKPPELIAYAESLEVENASVMRKQELNITESSVALAEGSAFVTISGAILYGLVVLGAVMALRERRLQ